MLSTPQFRSCFSSNKQVKIEQRRKINELFMSTMGRTIYGLNVTKIADMTISSSRAFIKIINRNMKEVSVTEKCVLEISKI
ncbi:hypothetical protein KSF78_0004979 [Schistosoma japonicum]|nr:hypothetical protein KSF78_0004979 [Schistosoma japonicum]